MRRAVTKTVRVLDTGAFTWTGKLRHPGVYRVRATYAGDDTHQSSHANRKMRVKRARR